MWGLLNLGSLILGLIAWILPIVSLTRRNKMDRLRGIILCLASVCACAISLNLQIFYSNHLVRMENWSALMDTSSAVLRAATVLLAGTILLNGANLIVYCGKKANR